jgi:hypothetical protein
MRYLLPLIAIAAATLPAASYAETIRLTPEQAEAAKEAGATKRQKAAEGDLPDGLGGDRAVHGEVGVAVGTGGYRSMYGVVGVPLGDRGEAVIGYSQSRGRFYGPGYGYGYGCRGIDSLMCRSAYDLDRITSAP